VTNRANSLDSAILRRTAGLYHFDRPNVEQRKEVFRRIFQENPISEAGLNKLAARTEPRQITGFDQRKHRYTYSDLIQRIAKGAIEEAVYSRQPLTFDLLDKICASTYPTPEFQED